MRNNHNPASYLLLNNKTFHITIWASAILCFVLLLLIESWDINTIDLGFIKIANAKIYTQMIPVMILTSLSGYTIGADVVLIYFSVITMHDGFAFRAFFLMVASVIANIPIVKQWYKSIWKTIIAFLIFTIVLGPGWNTFLYILESDSFSIPDFQSIITSQSPAITCAIVCLFCYLYYNFVPKKIHDLFFASTYDSEELLQIKKAIAKYKHGRSINGIIFFIIFSEALILAIAAMGFANALYSQHNASLENTISEIITQNIHNYADYFIEENIKKILDLHDWDSIIFACRMFALMTIITVPVIFSIISVTNIQITNPIILMALSTRHSSNKENNDDEDCLEIHKLGIKNKDEIGILYEALIEASDNIGKQIESLKREKKLQNDLEIAKAATKAKSSFLSNMSHEIRTPINAVLGLDEMIIRESTETDIINYALDIQNAGKSLLSLVNDILDFSKIESGKLEIIPTDYDLSSTINDLVNMIAKRAEDKGLELIINIEENIPNLLYGDEIRIKQCAINILTNAVKYTRKGSVTLSVSYTKTSDNYINLTFHIKDTGIGIKEEDIPKLFTAFQRIEEKRNRSIEGTGLGMNIVQQLLGLMGSELGVNSVYGEGSDFFFTVEQRVIKWEPIGNFNETYKKSVASAKTYKESFRAPNARILVVDDTRMNLTVMKGLLKRTQVQLDMVESGPKALDLAVQNHYDVMFIDHRMPGMDGIETLHALSTLAGNKNIGVPSIALTANAVNGAREMYIAEGFTDYLTKPVDSAKLERMLLDYIPKEKIESVPDDTEQTNDSAEQSSSNNNNLEKQNTDNDFCSCLKNIEGINVQEAIKNCGGEDVLQDVVKDFYNSIEEKANLIEQYAFNKDYKNYTILVHALKSTSRLIGAMELSKKAAILEKQGNEQNGDFISLETPVLLSMFRAYKEKLETVLQPCDEDSDKEEIDSNQLKEAFTALNECMQGYDFDTAGQVIQMLEQYRMPDSKKDLFSNIKKKINACDHAAVLDLLKNELEG